MRLKWSQLKEIGEGEEGRNMIILKDEKQSHLLHVRQEESMSMRDNKRAILEWFMA